MVAYTKDLPEGWEVLIDHVHADMYVISTNSDYPSLKQDYMDDKYHGYTQDGFYIDNKEKYENIFSIDPTNETFVSGWNGYINTSRVRESDMDFYGFIGNELYVVFDLLIKRPGDKFYHTKSISQSMVMLKPEYINQ